MSRPFDVRLPLEQAYLRRSLFAIELLDAVTMERVSEGVTVVAEGLHGKPRVNAGGLFVWTARGLSTGEPDEPLPTIGRVRIEPGTRPYETVELEPADLALPPAPLPLTTVELPPRLDYAFAPGITGARGTLVESRVTSPVPVPNAEVRLRWLDDDGVTWRDAPTISHTTAGGDFVSVLRFRPTDVPRLGAANELTVRLWVRRDATSVRRSADLLLPQARISDRANVSALTVAWDELVP
jgi:hypothetical protein